MKTTPQLLCVAEDWMLLEGAVLYGFISPENGQINIVLIELHYCRVGVVNIVDF